MKIQRARLKLKTFPEKTNATYIWKITIEKNTVLVSCGFVEEPVLHPALVAI